MGDVNSILHRRRGSGGHEDAKFEPIRLSGTTTQQEAAYEKSPNDAELGDAIGRQGNEHKTPDADFFLINEVQGNRYQDIANTHLSEGPKPGRIPRRWTNLVKGVLGKHITGTVDGDSGVYKASQLAGGAEDGAYLQHISIPRNSVIARAYSRTVDDAAPIPAVYVGDPTRR